MKQLLFAQVLLIENFPFFHETEPNLYPYKCLHVHKFVNCHARPIHQPSLGSTGHGKCHKLDSQDFTHDDKKALKAL